MRVEISLQALWVLLAIWPLAARAQQADRMRRIGVLMALRDDKFQNTLRTARSVMMNITDLAHIADIVAAIGVIGSMIFVGVQVRQSTRSIRSSALQQQANQWQEYADLWQKFYGVFSDPKIAATYAKALAGRDLEQAEYGRFFLMCRAVLIKMESLHYQFQQGLIDKGVYARAQLSMQEEFFAFPGIRAMWQLTRHYYGSDFAEFLDKILASTPIHQRQSSYKKWKELVADNQRLSKPISGGSKN